MPPPGERCSHLVLFTSPHLLFTLISVPPFASRMSSLRRFLFMFCSLESKPNSLIRFSGPRGHERPLPQLFEESEEATLLLPPPPSVSKILQSPGFFSQMLKSRLHVQPFVISELISERSCSVLALSARSSSCWILWGSHSDLLVESCSCLCRRGWTLSPSCCIWFLSSSSSCIRPSSSADLHCTSSVSSSSSFSVFSLFISSLSCCWTFPSHLSPSVASLM